MAENRTARVRAREELTREIKELAQAQLIEDGAAQLSLRAIARDLGMASSALYRYFPSRDHLLTVMIMDAYSDLADVLVLADRALPHGASRKRWLAVCVEMRTWAVQNAQRFGLIYGSPVPGYRAPVDTTVPAERVMIAVTGIIEDAAIAGNLAQSVGAGHREEAGRRSPPIPAKLRTQLGQAGQLLGEHIPAPELASTIAAFAQVIGMINLELGGHFVGGFEPADLLFRHSIERLADDLGLA